MLDIYAPADLFPLEADRPLAEKLTHALLAAEGISAPGPAHLHNTAAYVHRLPASAVHTAAMGNARTVRVQVLTPPGALNREGQKAFVKEATAIVAQLCGDPSQARRTWVLLTEAAEGGWGVAGNALGRAEFAAAAAAAETAAPR
jgi:phenylpyruvate tautomerase PptA (4-oxalocrotonate tautomerase family)